MCTIQPCTGLRCNFTESHRRRVRVCLAVTCHLQFWENDRDLLRATAVTRGWNAYRRYESAQKVHPGEENSPAVPVGTRTRDLSIASPTLYHCAIPAPQERGAVEFSENLKRSLGIWGTYLWTQSQLILYHRSPGGERRRQKKRMMPSMPTAQPYHLLKPD